jgi:hypothetical protein
MLLFLTKTNPPMASSTVGSFALAERVGSVQRIAIDRNDPIIDPPGNLIGAPMLLRGDERTLDNSRVSDAMTMPVIDKPWAPQRMAALGKARLRFPPDRAMICYKRVGTGAGDAQIQRAR